MPSLLELARTHTALEGNGLAHLQRLVASWGLLADFCFADLLLLAPTRDQPDSRFVVLGQIRPTTSQTLYREDWIGRVVDDIQRPLVARAFRLGEMVDGEVTIDARGERARIQCIPVRCAGELLAVMTRESGPSVGRRPGELERVYVEIFDCFARMILAGDFPFDTTEPAEEAPRVGDGVMLLDEAGRIVFGSPNAMSAVHRMGVISNVEGARLDEVGVATGAVEAAMTTRLPATEEVESGTGVIVLVRCIPLLEQGTVTGAVLLLRDVSELRRRDRLLLSKDATIREIHHRVKNNLQTISSLLRLQGRRLEAPEAKEAIEESVRRIRSIALVHEILSHGAGDDVSFNEIVRPLVRMVEEAVLSPDRPVRFAVEGDAGELSAEVATPLAVVLTELLQNAVEHGYPERRSKPRDPATGTRVEGHVRVILENNRSELRVVVRDDGVGLPDTFDVGTTRSLGLSIVRALVTSELAGSIEMRNDSGTVVELRVPVRPRARIER